MNENQILHRGARAGLLTPTPGSMGKITIYRLIDKGSAIFVEMYGDTDFCDPAKFREAMIGMCRNHLKLDIATNHDSDLVNGRKAAELAAQRSRGLAGEATRPENSDALLAAADALERACSSMTPGNDSEKLMAAADIADVALLKLENAPGTECDDAIHQAAEALDQASRVLQAEALRVS